MKNDPLADEVRDRWKKVDDDLISDRRHYWMNHAFFKGHQWLWWDATRRTPGLLPPRNSEDERVRTTVNQIRPRILRLIGRQAQQNLFFDVQASSPDDATTQGAQLAAHVLEFRRMEDDWESIREQNLLNQYFGGTAAISYEWDDQRGPLWEDPDNGDLVGEGEVVLRPWSISEFGLEPGAPSRDEARWWMACQVLPAAQVQSFYELSWEPEPDAHAVYSPMQRKLLSDQYGTPPTKMTAVFTMYERPNKLCKSGRVVHVVNGQVVRKEEDWPYPFEHLNLQTFRQTTMPATWKGDTILNDCRSLQVQYNAVQSNLLEHTKLAGNARLWIARGTVDDTDALTDEPGEMHMYDADMGPKPEYSTPPALPRSITQQLDTIAASLDDLLYSHDVSRGVAPGDRNSGLALSVLAEHNDTPLGPMSRREGECWARLAECVLQLYEKNATEKRTAVVMGERNVPRVFDWNGQRLRGQHKVTVPVDVTLPQNRAVMQAQIADLAGRFPQLFAQMTPATLARLLRLPRQEMLQGVLDPDADLAQWENWRMAAEEVIHPSLWNDHAKHISEHNAFRNSPEYLKLPQDVQDMMSMHIQAHQRFEEEQAAQQATTNAAVPGLAGMPQADAPPGSGLPAPAAMQPPLQALPGGKVA